MWPAAAAGRPLHLAAPVEPARDHTARVVLEGLAPDTRYRWRVRFGRGGFVRAVAGPALEGTFRTAPAPDAPAPLRLAFGGDLAGQNVCRDAALGFPVFEAVAARAPDLFVTLGDMIYADGTCEAVGRYGNAQVPGGFGPALDRAGFDAHWRYAREDPSHQRLLATTSLVAVWDDHEVRNDFGPRDDRPAPPAPPVPLMGPGLAAFLDHNPLPPGAGHRLYRRLRWGRHLELFVLDTRQYRAPDALPDDGPEPKTMLGRAQREWLVRAMTSSDATWKVVVSSVPLAIPTGVPPEAGRDGWADGGGPTGFERELLAVLRALREAGVRESVWLTADVHHAQRLRHVPFPESPRFVLHELVTGPLNAGLFPEHTLDETLHPERLFFHGPPAAGAVRDFDDARSFFNFGELEVDAGGALRLRVLDSRGRLLYEEALAPPPPSAPSPPH